MAQLMSIKKNVDVQPGAGVPAIFHCSQGDKGTRIILGLLNNNDSYTIPEGTTAIIRGSRADGTLFTEITADIDTTTEIKFNLTEDMTSVAGPVECEAVMSSGTANVIGTANFIVNVEKSPASVGSVFPGTDAAETWLVNELTNLDISDLDDESVVDAINSKLGGTFETTDAGKVLMVNNDGTVSPEDVDLSGKANESTIAPEFSASASYTAGSYVYKNGVLYRFTAAHSGAWTGSDAEVVTVGGELTRLDNGSGSGLTEDIKTALLACFEKVAWIDEDGQDYYDALYDAFYNNVWSITNTLSNCITSNNAQSVNKGGSYSATITASSGYTLNGASVVITMGGVNITSSAYNNGVISIAQVTGALTITISAVIDLSPDTPYTSGYGLYLDAIANTGTTHDATYMNWTDKSSNEYEFIQYPTSAKIAFESNCFDFAGGTHYFDLGSQTAKDWGTIEVVIEGTSNTEVIMETNKTGSGNFGIVSTKNGSVLFNTGGSLSVTLQEGIHTYACDGTNVYVDGEVATAANVTVNWGTMLNAWRIGAWAGNNYIFTGKLYAIRCYDSILTAEQIAFNRSIDAARFVA